MIVNVFELLQRKTVAVTVDLVIRFAQNNNIEDFNHIILQFFVNVLERDHTLTLDELNLMTDADEFKKILVKIYQNDFRRDDAVLSDTIKSFLNKLLLETFEIGLLNSAHVVKWMSFLQMIIVNPNIPEKSVFKGSSTYLLSMLLHPLASLFIAIQSANDNTNNADELAVAIENSLKTIMELVPMGFAYKKLCVPIALEFTDAMENYPEIFITEMPSYKKMMLQENFFLHKLTLKSLKKLCTIDTIKEQLKNFLLEHNQQPSEYDSFMNLIQELSKRKALKADVVSFLREMTKLQPGNDFLGDELRLELYSNVFSGRKKLVAETLSLMIEMEDEPWANIIQLMSVTENIDLPHFLWTLSSIDEVGCDLKSLLKILLEQLDSPEASQRAAEVFVAMLKLNDAQKEEILGILNTVLEKCSVDELTFCLMLDCFTMVDIEKVSTFYKKEPQVLLTLIHYMVSAFEKFDRPETLYKIVDVLKNLSKMSSAYVLKQIRWIFHKHYNQLLDVYSVNNEDKPSFKTPITKLTVLLENRSWNIIPLKAMPIIFRIDQDLCHESNDPMFPLFIQFHANFLSHLWARLVINKKLEFPVDVLSDSVKSLFSSLFQVLTSEEDIQPNDCLLLCSLLKVAVMFQPAMRDHSDNEIFELAEIKLDKPNVKAMAMLVEKYAFVGENQKSDDEALFQCKMVLLNWISFCKNYTKLPSLTSSEIIVRHYRLKHPLKVQMDLLLEHLLTQKSIFEQTITVVTFNMSIQDDLATYIVFHQALEDFISRHFKDANKRASVMNSICSYILSKLKPHVEGLMEDGNTNRFLVLDYVSVLIKNMSAGMKKKLETFLPSDWESCILTDGEKKHLETFKMSLQR